MWTIIVVIIIVKRPFELTYDPEAAHHLRQIERRHHSLIQQAVKEQLSYEPAIETRNRKPLERVTDLDPIWEIRFGPNDRFRVFYEIDRPSRDVFILAIGVKVGNRLFIGGEEFEI